MKKMRGRFFIFFILLGFLFPGLAEANNLPGQDGVPPLLRSVLSDTVREGIPLRRQGFNGSTATRREALRAAYEILGWGHELAILERLSSEDPVSSLSSAVEPPPPGAFLESPGEQLTGEDLSLLLGWMRDCRLSMRWDFTARGESVDLRLHKEGIASQEGAWEVRLEQGLEEKVALEKLEDLVEGGWPGALRETPDGLFDLVVGPYPSFLEASRTFSTLPRVPGMHMAPPPSSAQSAPPLFWAALVSRNLAVLPDVRFAMEIGRPRAFLSELALAFEAEGGINGGFFSSLGPVGTLVVNGTLFHQSYGERSAIGLAPGNPPVFGNGGLSLRVDTKNGPVNLDRLNELPRKDEISLFLENSPFQDPDGLESRDLAGMPVTAEIVGSLPVPPMGGILVYPGESRQPEGIEPGSLITVGSVWSNPRFEGSQFVLQAGPGIVENGQANSASESFDEKTRLERHPRSMVGWDGSALWWIVIDGRDPSHSLGLTLQDSAALALSLGLTEVLNLDGGGSSSIWWRNGLVSCPSGGKERPIPYAILFGTPSANPLR